MLKQMKDEIIRLAARIKTGLLSAPFNVLKSDSGKAPFVKVPTTGNPSHMHDYTQNQAAIRSAVIISLGNLTAREWGCGTLSEVHIVGEEESVVVTPLNDGSIHTAIIKH